MEHTSSCRGFQDSSDFSVVFYDPNQPSEGRLINDEPKARWERLADRIVSAQGRLYARLETPALADLGLAPRAGQDKTPDAGGNHLLDITTRLGHGTKLATPGRELRELLFASICSILYASGRAAPEELDRIMGICVQSSNSRYLDRLKRGAKIANEIIALWAVPEDHACRNGCQLDTQLQRLDQATQAILQARLTLPQWGLLNSNSSNVKRYIQSHPLPHAPPTTARPPLFIPCLIESITSGILSIPQICSYLGYSSELASRMAEVRSWRSPSLES
ncbi:hypothetical protein M406DRAFT_104602 [Cryphonectria parasitica EP155]|uniref:Uncharacterized protein n=1 Tax=Cryphonectria parasitica (strain ATCC 38755 / EP155) TaxID=660469 RepID=A0A9P5CHR8_CRYP1|nr:uncharacterized protein M406DRAFT_104602 [Cryphonectria parasitica EP155]KAF3760098.1 hypothetical protein M406DRAFT_104602 [Cryphonectria parasitica EP155]